MYQACIEFSIYAQSSFSDDSVRFVREWDVDSAVGAVEKQNDDQMCEGIKGRRCTTHTECHPSGVSTCASVIVAFDAVDRRSREGWAGTVDHSKATWSMPDSTPRRPWIMPDSISKSIVAASPSMGEHHSEHQTTAPCLQHTTSVYRVPPV